MEAVNPVDARMLEATASRQFGKQLAAFLHENRARIGIERSKNTDKIRFVYLGGERILVLRPEEGFFSLLIPGARILNDIERDSMVNGIFVQDDVAEFIKNGKNVFAKHVRDPPSWIRPSQELYVCDGQRNLLAVGKAVLSGRDMQYFKRGVAVKIRHGIQKSAPGSEADSL
nr:pseudouridine synthase [Candidatus Sigynarchaeota archaeon]